jgi:hypothetical protein
MRSRVITLNEVIEAVGNRVEVKETSPCVRYEVNIEKLQKVADVPNTRSTVLAYVEEYLDEK